MARPSFQNLDDADLLEQLAETKDELFKLRFQLATGQLTNHARIRQTRKDIARIHTELRAREIAASEALAAEATPVHEESA
jgi:large subunit ribosomal protein L29